MKLLEVLKTDFELHDDRGDLVQLVHGGYSQVNVITSKSGVRRGGHFHKISAECFYVVSGKVEVLATKDSESEKVQFKSGDFFMIKPGIIHSLYFPEDCILVSMYDVNIESEDGSKDIYQVE